MTTLIKTTSTLFLALLFGKMPAGAQTNLPDGQKDFDFEVGNWHTELRRLVKPLTGSTTWVTYQGRTLVRSVWEGRASQAELDVTGTAGSIKGLSFRVYDPQAKQWSLYYANANGGALAVPTVGSFRNGRGEFYDQETYNGRAILVRFLVIPHGSDSISFEQAFSEDGGKTWEVNWIATDTRIKEK